MNNEFQDNLRSAKLLTTCYSLLVTRYTLLITVPILVLAGTARAQLTHLDSSLARSLTEATGSLDRNGVNVIADSSFLPIVRMLPAAHIPSAPIFYIDQLYASVASVDSPATMHIVLHGSIVRPGNAVAEQHSWNFTTPIALSFADREVLETNSDRYVHLNMAYARSFWDTTIEPVLVILGAAAIVALFFLIRS